VTFPESPQVGLTTRQKDLTLDVIALLRVSVENQSPQVAQESIQALLGPLTVDDIIQMLWRLVQITDLLLSGWYSSLYEASSVEDREQLPKPSEMLDQFVEQVIAQPTIEEEL